jgi:hypothetical protein
MPHMRILFVLFFFFIAAGISAQDSAWKQPIDSNSVVIHKDPRIDLLVRKQAQINDETSRDARKTSKGFRLMIINTNKREEAIAAKTKVYTYFPELKAYLLYQSPYFKLKVGNFKERKDAESYQKRLNVYFPKGVFVMNDVIEVKPGKFTDDDIQP